MRSNRRRAHTRIPHQRTTEGGVAVLLSRRGESCDAVRYGARSAVERGLVLLLVLPHVPDDEQARGLALMDQALLAARNEAPHLEVRVHLGRRDVTNWLDEVDLAVDQVVIDGAEVDWVAASDAESDDLERAMLSFPGCQVVVV